MAARLDRLYASPQVVAQRERLRALIAARPGEQGVDVGCGLAHLSCELALDVRGGVGGSGESGRIVAIDASADMVSGAAERAERLGVAGIVVPRLGDATVLDLPDASVDFVVAVQSYSYVPDIDRAIAEAARVLRPGGRLAVLETDWDMCIYRSDDDAMMRRIFDGQWRFAHWQLPRELNAKFRAVGLTPKTTEVFPIVETSYDRDAFGVGLLAIARNASVKHGLDAEAAKAWVDGVHARGAAGDYFFCVNRFMFIAVK
jgi:ubiquinone/menaquinone biosynthesis C-methylase UbiE